MSTIQEYFQQAQLAEAAYAHFDLFVDPKNALMDARNQRGQARIDFRNWKSRRWRDGKQSIPQEPDSRNDLPGDFRTA